MKHDDFAYIVSNTIQNIQKLMHLKGGEYAGDDDRLANFKRNAVALGVTPELIWAVYAGKHWDAVQQYVSDMQQGKTRERGEPIEGRLDDLIAYCILLKGIIKESKRDCETSADRIDSGAAEPPAEGVQSGETYRVNGLDSPIGPTTPSSSAGGRVELYSGGGRATLTSAD